MEAGAVEKKKRQGHQRIKLSSIAWQDRSNSQTTRARTRPSDKVVVLVQAEAGVGAEVVSDVADDAVAVVTGIATAREPDEIVLIRATAAEPETATGIGISEVVGTSDDTNCGNVFQICVDF